MTFMGFLKSGKKGVLLLFLAGFFIGGILYTLCMEPAADQLDIMGERAILWAESEVSFWIVFLHVIWERGKVLALLWLAGGTKLYKGYIRLFLIYVGMQIGFMLLYFLNFQGVRGLLLWFGMMIPHELLLVPIYLYSFFGICEKRHERSVMAVSLILLCLLAACVLETAGNIPLMQWLLQT